MSALHNYHDDRQVSNNAFPNRRRFQTACPSCQNFICTDLVQEPHPKPWADWTSWSLLVSMRWWTRHSDNAHSGIYSGWGSRPDSSILYIQNMCGCQEVILPASWTTTRCVNKPSTWESNDFHRHTIKITIFKDHTSGKNSFWNAKIKFIIQTAYRNCMLLDSFIDIYSRCADVVVNCLFQLVR